MRWQLPILPWPILALVLLAGCQKSFDDRYADAQKKLDQRAASIDQDLAAKASEAAMGQAMIASGSSTDAPETGAGTGAGPAAGVR